MKRLLPLLCLLVACDQQASIGERPDAGSLVEHADGSSSLDADTADLDGGSSLDADITTTPDGSSTCTGDPPTCGFWCGTFAWMATCRNAEWVCDRTGAPTCSDAAVDAQVPNMPDVSHTYVISSLSIPQMTGADTAVGFNLDDVNSNGTCRLEPCTCVESVFDFVSADDPTQTGIDNQLSILVPTIETLINDGEALDDLLLAQIVAGSLLLLLEVSEINSYQEDAEVMVQLHTGTVPAGATIQVAGSTIAPNQVFDVTPMGGPNIGRIVGGRLRFSAPRVTIPISPNLDLHLRSATLEASVSPDGLVAGVMGGSVNVEEFADGVDRAMPGLRDTVIEVLGGTADMSPDSADMTMCTALSAGMRFGAIPAMISSH